ncbi:type IX secretion system sortase PorU [Algivirga pacifica]|uniref:Gingipain domain-containing protein n=1 Tax=Algivirga pacifica TaxID=1162670 RepID=A0ABP9DHL7_9BACT
MIKYIYHLLLLLILQGGGVLTYAQGVLADGTLLKLEIKEHGVYKIDASLLKAEGIQWQDLSENQIRLYGVSSSGMLPQPNSELIAQLVEIPLKFSGAKGASLTDQDYFLFYGEGPSKVYFDTLKALWREETHLYDIANFYFLKVLPSSGTEAKRITNNSSATDQGTIKSLTHYVRMVHHENEQRKLLSNPSGRYWYGERISGQLTLNFPATSKEINGSVKGLFSIAAKSKQLSTVDITLGQSIPFGKVEIAGAPSYNSYKYGRQGNISEVLLDAEEILIDEDLALELTLQTSDTEGQAYLDFVTLNYHQPLIFSGETSFYHFIDLQESQEYQFSLQEVESIDELWNVTDPLAAKVLAKNLAGEYATQFAQSAVRLIAFQRENVRLPTLIGRIENQDLEQIATPDLLIVTHSDFVAAAQHLADFRRDEDGLLVEVVEVDKIYNLYSGGKQDPVAIRNYVRRKYLHSNKLKYLLLVGDASFDYRGFQYPSSSWVPIYESRDGLSPTKTFSSDDFFAFMDEDEGVWLEDFETTISDEYDMEIGVGRLPVTTLEQAQTAVQKIIDYQLTPTTAGKWRSQITFVADDGDGNIHQEQANSLATYIDDELSTFSPYRIFLDNYEEVSTANGAVSDDCNQVLLEAIRQGSLIVNYSGHGSTAVWADERILRYNDVLDLNNKNRLPLFVTATCEFGRYDHPVITSAAEELLLNPKGGGVALLTTTRPVTSHTNFKLNKAFYDVLQTLYRRGEKVRLGDLCRLTKNNSLAGVSNRNFALLGDPSMALGMPPNNIRLQSVNQSLATSVDTLRALQEVMLTGEVVEGIDRRDTTFNGTVEVTLYGQKEKKQTLGNEGEESVFSYEAQEGIVFRGKASVKQGQFTSRFIIPKDIDYTIAPAKLSFYAFDSLHRDVAGAHNQLLLGGSADPSLVNEDTEGPIINALINDVPYVEGVTIGQSALLSLELQDASGINVSTYSLGHEIWLEIDGVGEFDLTPYYSTDPDTYQTGRLSFPLNELPEGEHELIVTAWDTHNNYSETSLKINVAYSESLVLRDVRLYPNPIIQGQDINVRFEHDYEGEAMEVDLMVYSMEGTLVYQDSELIPWTEREQVLSWKGEKAFSSYLRKGIYICKIKVRNKGRNLQGEYYLKMILN